MPIRSAVSADSWPLESQTARGTGAPRPARPLSVLHVIAPGAIGGAESVVAQLAIAQRDRDMAVTVATIVDSRDDCPLLDALRSASIDVRRVNVAPRGYLAERRELASLCASLAPTVVHSHGYRADVVDAPHLRKRGVPIVTTVHGFTGGGARNRCYEWLQTRSYRLFDAVVAVSSPLQRQLSARVPSDRVHCVPNAYRAGAMLPRESARAALGIPLHAFVVGWVGRLSHEKGADVFLDALADLALPECVHAAILGDGAERAALHRQAARRSLDDRVSWHGSVAHAARLLRAFDAIVLSSRTEGTPMVLFEAMAAGVPLIATNVGGVPDVLPAGTALLVAPESPRELGAAIRAVFLESAAAAARARLAYARLHEAYGPSAWADRYATIYRSAVETAAR